MGRFLLFGLFAVFFCVPFLVIISLIEGRQAGLPLLIAFLLWIVWELKKFREYEVASQRANVLKLKVTASEIWKEYFCRLPMTKIDGMSGIEFEKFVAKLLDRMGFQNVTLTAHTGDQGGDILCIQPSSKVRAVVQVKRWKSSLGNKVVQEILGAMLHYGTNTGMIITNSRFTVSAKALAAKDRRIILCDGEWLKSQIVRFFPKVVPEFSWSEFLRLEMTRDLPYPLNGILERLVRHKKTLP